MMLFQTFDERLRLAWFSALNARSEFFRLLAGVIPLHILESQPLVNSLQISALGSIPHSTRTDECGNPLRKKGYCFHVKAHVDAVYGLRFNGHRSQPNDWTRELVGRNVQNTKRLRANQALVAMAFI